ncbi:hypothetical protein VNO78_20797 [Psophocarpus tetragonolobus]|uniref:Uncharacterized protein n=1 Tax=Psophocarpus tetragonolobus TaxID=3891 RepID=A0AAN9XHJ6_PSOTE
MDEGEEKAFLEDQCYWYHELKLEELHIVWSVKEINVDHEGENDVQFQDINGNKKAVVESDGIFWGKSFQYFECGVNVEKQQLQVHWLARQLPLTTWEGRRVQERLDRVVGDVQ